MIFYSEICLKFNVNEKFSQLLKTIISISFDNAYAW